MVISFDSCRKVHKASKKGKKKALKDEVEDAGNAADDEKQTRPRRMSAWNVFWSETKSKDGISVVELAKQCHDLPPDEHARLKKLAADCNDAIEAGNPDPLSTAIVHGVNGDVGGTLPISEVAALWKAEQDSS